jgi:hypothetical protein
VRGAAGKEKLGGREEKKEQNWKKKKQNRGRAKCVPLFLLKETEALGAILW